MWKKNVHQPKITPITSSILLFFSFPSIPIQQHLSSDDTIEEGGDDVSKDNQCVPSFLDGCEYPGQGAQEYHVDGDDRQLPCALIAVVGVGLNELEHNDEG